MEKEDREKGKGRRNSGRRKPLSIARLKEMEGSIHISQRQSEGQL